MAPAPTRENNFRCHSPDGRNYDLSTNDGADAFVTGMPEFLQDNIQNILDPIRARIAGTNPDPRDAQMLFQTYNTIGLVAARASPQLFSEMIASDHMSLWVNHVAKILQELTMDPRWIRTGVLARHDQTMLECLKPTAKQYGMRRRMVETKFLHVLAEFVRARPAPQMPCAEVAEAFFSVAGNVHCCLRAKDATSDLPFRKLDSSGLLAQTLRCLTVPLATNPNEVSRQLCFLDEVLKQFVQLRRKFKASSPTGAILHAIVNDQDGHAHCPQAIKERLKSLAQLLDYAGHGERLTKQRLCRLCNKNRGSKELLACSRCKGEYCIALFCVDVLSITVEAWRLLLFVHSKSAYISVLC